MRWDAPLLASLARTLDDRLRGARLRAVAPDFDAQRMALHFREATLLIRLHPNEAGVFLLDAAEPPPEARPLASKLRGVSTPADDRILIFSFLRVRGRPAEADLVVEWITNRHNLVLTEGPDRIARMVFHTRDGDRPVRQGQPWRLPEPQLREGRDGPVSLERWREVVGALEPGREGRRALLSTFAWTSPLNAAALLRLDPEEGWRRWSELGAIARGERDPDPVLLDTDRGLQPYPLALPGAAHRPMASLLAAIEEATRARGVEAAPTLIPASLLDRLDRHLESLRARCARVEEQLDTLPDPDREQALGDLILARYADVPQGVARVTLTDFEGAAVEVSLDPTLSPHENARARYDEAARIRRAAERLPGLVTEARTAWEAAASLRERADAGDVTADELRSALPDTATGGSGDTGAPLPYRRYTSSGGLEIRVGRGSRRNDDLTFRHSAPDDIWLHARDVAGAHVILRWPHDGNPPARDLAEAAVLAALGSKARTSGSVPVDWTRRKYVRKPRKAPPGLVTPGRVQTVFVEPDPRLEVKLRAE
ncbi:NFACT RNA binding domain-containing protein [Gaopeijia maritima]|uniref:NFACT RNA binding domain-containing protein n=1 Tax=Gaopeijia maritima TaxID=3119007 RepID=UPI0032522108